MSLFALMKIMTLVLHVLVSQMKSDRVCSAVQFSSHVIAFLSGTKPSPWTIT